MAFLEASGVRKTYTVGGRELQVLRDLDLTVEAGEMVAIVGASGVGKSTLLHVLGGLDRVETGTIVIGDAVLTTLPDPEVVSFRNRNIGFVFQFHHLLPEFTAVENASTQLGRKLSPTIYTSKELSKRRKQDSAFVARVLAQPKLWLIGDERALAA